MIAEIATINASPELITNSRYAKYIAARLTTAVGTTQTVVVVFNIRSIKEFEVYDPEGLRILAL